MTTQATVVLVAGSLHYDIIVEADHLPRRDETGIGRRWYPKFGGKGGNQAVSAQMQGVPARLFAAIGADAFGIFLRDRLDSNGIDHRHVAVCPGSGSGISVATLDAAGDYAATIVSGANLLLDPAALREPALWSDVGLLVLQNEIPEPVNIAAAEQARRRGIPTLLNAAPCREMSAEFQRLVDILVVNAVEAEMMGTAPITNLETAADAAQMLAGRFKTVIVTAG